MADELSFTVNGAPVRVEAGGSVPLVYVLRNDLDLKGTRFGCGTGHCGACMVWIDGRPAKSCDTPVSAVEGRHVVTIEGLGSGTLHAVQRAILARQAGQCGYCLSGIIMTAAALLRDERAPARERIAKALDGHICRCGAHARILDAMEQAAVHG